MRNLQAAYGLTLLMGFRISMYKNRIYNHHTELSYKQKQQIVSYLISERLKNYGYDNYRKMQVERNNLRNAIRKKIVGHLAWDKLDLSNLYFKQTEEDKEPVFSTYLVRTCKNKEVTDMLKALLSK